MRRRRVAGRPDHRLLGQVPQLLGPLRHPGPPDRRLPAGLCLLLLLLLALPLLRHAAGSRIIGASISWLPESGLHFRAHRLQGWTAGAVGRRLRGLPHIRRAVAPVHRGGGARLRLRGGLRWSRLRGHDSLGPK